MPAPASSLPDAPQEILDDTAIDAVIDWFTVAGRDLPWRHDDTSSWSILVSEIMLQQTPVVRVLPRWLEWMHRWPTPRDLDEAPTAEVLRAWDRLGYPRRALRLKDCAHAIVTDHDGEVPRGPEALRALPGIGEYTAGAVTAFAHHGRAVVADTNIRRVLVRSVRGEASPGAAFTASERALATNVLPEDPARSVRWNQAVMELGALVCTARSPRCDACPLSSRCRWFTAGRPAQQGPPVRRQAFEGTDRQMRGRIMALLREGPASVDQVLGLADSTADDRPQRCLDSLVRDGLATLEEGTVRLP
ncbi:adenine glycosylase [Brachybacterium endophyticum]|uniref:Adenine DNA glycosylase n=1 Tax=Brachybacterium endophyticum TaxID=2182385 RepID=A0A2U2RM54_9MICO|nr:A/G-specific adenine glycosylase [Brachybacterium endophyticum]PWH06948.1 adenine glycosylase [Brachybacterium endophyticum]